MKPYSEPKIDWKLWKLSVKEEVQYSLENSTTAKEHFYIIIILRS